MKSLAPLEIMSPDSEAEVSEITFFPQWIPAGFPSPAAPYEEPPIDLNKELIRHPSSTFIARVNGHSMEGGGIHDGDLLIIDKSIAPKSGHFAVCFIDGEYTLKCIEARGKKLFLKPLNTAYSELEITEYNTFQVWGVVTAVIKKLL